MADCFVMPSLCEVLSRSVMEAMASELPCVVSRIRGNVDLVVENVGGFFCEPTNINEFAGAIGNLVANPKLCRDMSKFNKNKIKEFDMSVVEDALKRIYAEI